MTAETDFGGHHERRSSLSADADVFSGPGPLQLHTWHSMEKVRNWKLNLGADTRLLPHIRLYGTSPLVISSIMSPPLPTDDHGPAYLETAVLRIR